MSKKDREYAVWEEHENRRDCIEFLIHVILFILGLILLIRIEVLTDIGINEIKYYEVGVRHPLPPLELK